MRYAWHNDILIPEKDAKLSIYDSALMFGDMVFEMIQEADIDTRSEYYKHIVLSGGSSMYPGTTCSYNVYTSSVHHLYLFIIHIIYTIYIIDLSSISSFVLTNTLYTCKYPRYNRVAIPLGEKHSR